MQTCTGVILAKVDHTRNL